MSSFTADDVRRLAALARLELTPEEIDAFARQLGEILTFATEVQAADLTALTPANTIPGAVLPPALAWRDDRPIPSLPIEDVLAAAPAPDERTGLVKVPRVLKG